MKLLGVLVVAGAFSLLAAVPVFAFDKEARAEARTAAFQEVDVDKDGQLSAEEFGGFHEALKKQYAERRFAKLDEDGNGQISSDELSAAGKHRHPCGHAGEGSDHPGE